MIISELTNEEELELYDDEYTNCSLSKIKVFFNGYVIFKKSCRSKSERNRAMAYYRNVFYGCESRLWFHVEHYIQRKQLKK